MNYITKAILIATFFSSISANLFSQNDTIAKPDSILLKQIEKQLNNSQTSPSPIQVRTAPPLSLTLVWLATFKVHTRIMSKEILMPESMKRSYLFNQLWILMPEPISFFTLGKDPTTGKFTEDLEEGYLYYTLFACTFAVKSRKI